MRFFNGSSFSTNNGFMDSKNLKNSSIFSFDEEEKKTASRSFLSSLLSKRMVIPMLGVLYVVLLNVCLQNGNTSSNIQFHKNVGRRILSEGQSTDEYSESNSEYVENPVIGSTFMLPNENPLNSLGNLFQADKYNVLEDTQKLIEDLNKFKYNSNYSTIPHAEKYNPVDYNKADYVLDKYIDNLGYCKGDIIKAMKIIWEATMNNERRKFASTKRSMYKYYDDLRRKRIIKNDNYASKLNRCNKIIENSQKQIETHLNDMFNKWFRQKSLFLDDFNRLITVCRIGWKTVSNAAQHQCDTTMRNKDFIDI
ncbi:Plasmodium exported protein (PHISTb), unknown function [Plasmodium sp. DRC-Itaito]|uniref:Plasmodium RESA N-terminal domain-containing protein n=1 Tax=Plasmodium gaboni TaxID=647221 RepID=A0ABY1UI91_9APIC|nr:Plasmodium exported protein (PHISTb), unknown function [Plasmodium gaboni]SOV21207.1 Plasmodium exported protein (PHISTb), unknown function [Plasmodium sp. DRC-Itaito]